MKSFISIVRSELKTIISSIAGAILILLFLVIWRTFDTETFLFLQICATSLFAYVTIMLFRITGKRSIFLNPELAVIAISFVIITTLTLNIDRSRSVFVLKWVNELSSSSPVKVEEIVKFKDLSPLDTAVVAQRLDEQEQLGLLDEVGNGYKLSVFGNLFVKFASAFAKLMNLSGFARA